MERVEAIGKILKPGQMKPFHDSRREHASIISRGLLVRVSRNAICMLRSEDRLTRHMIDRGRNSRTLLEQII